MKTNEEKTNWLIEFANHRKFANIPLSEFMFALNPYMFSDDEEKYRFNLNFLATCFGRPVGASHTLGVTTEIPYVFDNMKVFKVLRTNSHGECLYEYADTEREKPRFNEWISPQDRIHGWLGDKDADGNPPAFYHFVIGSKAVKRYMKEAKILHSSHKQFDTKFLSAHEVEIKTLKLGLVTFSKNLSYFMWGGMTSEMFMHETPSFIEKL